MLQYQFPQCNQIESCTEIPHSLISIFSLNSFPNLHTHKRILQSPDPNYKFTIFKSQNKILDSFTESTKISW